jgi:hypothetical protein
MRAGATRGVLIYSTKLDRCVREINLRALFYGTNKVLPSSYPSGVESCIGK